MVEEISEYAPPIFLWAIENWKIKIDNSLENSVSLAENLPHNEDNIVIFMSPLAFSAAN